MPLFCNVAARVSKFCNIFTSLREIYQESKQKKTNQLEFYHIFIIVFFCDPGGSEEEDFTILCLPVVRFGVVNK